MVEIPWFYVDDGFSDSKPVLNMPARHRLAACGLWVLAGAWSAKEETDGRVPEAKLKQLGARDSLVEVLTNEGEFGAPLWVRVGREVQFNSWSKWQRTRAELIEKRESDAERQRAHRTRKRKGRNAVTSDDEEVSRCDTSVTPSDQDQMSRCDSRVTSRARAQTRPDPTRPIDNSSTEISALNVDPPRDVERGLSDPVNVSASRIVHENLRGRYPAAVMTVLRLKASELMNRDGVPADVLAETIRRWEAKPGAGPHALPMFAAEAIKAVSASRHGGLTAAESKIVGWAALGKATSRKELEP